MKNMVNKVSFQCKKHSPEILLIAGIGGVVTSAVMACKATTKASAIMDDMHESLETIKECKELNEEEKYSESDYKKDLVITYSQMVAGYVKLYGPSVMLGLASITSILASYNIMKKRSIAMNAAYAALAKGFSDYRERVVEKLGDQADKEFRYGFETKEIEETVTDEKGKEKKVKKKIEVVDDKRCSEFAKFFDASSRCWDKDPEANLMFLKAQESFANDRLHAQGHLFLNEVYDMLDIPRTKAGQVIGWVFNPDDEKSDGYIDFGIHETHKNARFVNGYEPAILLDFNVDGNVLDSMEWSV